MNRIGQIRFFWRVCVLPFVGLLTLSAGITGCATLPPESAAVDQSAAAALFAQHAQQTRAVINWQALGRLAIRTEQTGGSVSFDWRQRQNTTALILNAPLNQGSLSLTGTPDLMRIEDSSGQSRITQTPDQTLTQLTGWHIPIRALPDWLRALPHSPSAQPVFNDQGQLVYLRDEGWILHYNAYRPAFASGLMMPTEITADHRDIHLRIIIDQWQTLPSS